MVHLFFSDYVQLGTLLVHMNGQILENRPIVVYTRLWREKIGCAFCARCQVKVHKMDIMAWFLMTMTF